MALCSQCLLRLLLPPHGLRCQWSQQYVSSLTYISLMAQGCAASHIHHPQSCCFCRGTITRSTVTHIDRAATLYSIRCDVRELFCFSSVSLICAFSCRSVHPDLLCIGIKRIWRHVHDLHLSDGKTAVLKNLLYNSKSHFGWIFFNMMEKHMETVWTLKSSSTDSYQTHSLQWCWSAII